VIDASLDSIKRASKAVDVRIDIIQDRSSAETHQAVIANSRYLQEIQSTLGEIQANTSVVRIGMESVLEREASREAIADAV